MSAAFSLTTLGLDDAIAQITRLGNFDLAELADDAGAMLESSTRERFETRRAPDGQEWADWSPSYAQTRDDHHDLLISDGHLRDSISNYSRGSTAIVGTNLVQAAHLHFGGEETGSGIQARPFLGLSQLDERELKTLVTGRMEELLQ